MILLVVADMRSCVNRCADGEAQIATKCFQYGVCTRCFIDSLSNVIT